MDNEQRPEQYNIEDIYLKKDGSYLVTLDGYPFHVTEAETPEVYRAVRLLIDSGERCQEHVAPVISDAEVQANERMWRDSEIQRISWVRDRHRDQLDMGLKTTLSAEQFKELLKYTQALRDWPQAESFPSIAKRPAGLPWLDAVLSKCLGV
ncbi:phage tail assembly chaperone [Pseudomonas yamanorum]|uniref:Phage tail protein n=1 Tax=Pseudomonas yamanorum TaxID=515393 RepID=A0A7Y8JSF8_9PSED|nr:phage tail assembly chaperone [Pseudomonas yamanorum]NWE16998.1 phage tail protein [Pseudomonas yamanorum]